MKTKQEALEKIAELDKKLGLKTQEVEDGQRAMAKTVDDYEARLKALIESNRQLVKAEQLIQTLRELLVPAPAFVPNSGTAQPVEATLVKTLTKVKVETAPPTEVKYRDDKLPGRILKVIAEGGAEQKWEGFQLAQAIGKRWGETTSNLVGMELKKFSEAGVLARDAQPKHTYYWIPEGVVLEAEKK